MRSIRKLDESFLEPAVALRLEAYPGEHASPGRRDETRRGLQKMLRGGEGSGEVFGVVQDGRLLAQMVLHTFDLNCRGVMIPAGGIGSVATSLLDRKRGVARDMLLGALRYYRDQSRSVVGLYPFRPGFYRKMGFGYGAEVRRYNLDPASFPKHAEGPGRLRMLEANNPDDRRQMLDCYQTALAHTNGMISRLDPSMKDAFASDIAPVGYEHDGKLEGYLALDFDRQFVMKNNLRVREWVYNSAEAVTSLAGFLYRQQDQFEKIILETQDDRLSMLFNDLAADTYQAFESRYVESYTAGTGMLYRVVDLGQLLQSYAGALPNDVPDVRVKLTITDDFIPEQPATTAWLRCTAGRLTLEAGGDVDVEMATDVGSFSSLWMGAVDFASLIRLGLVSTSNSSWNRALQALFRVDDRPQCWQHF